LFTKGGIELAGMMKVRWISKVLLSPIVVLLVLCMGVGLFIGIPKFHASGEGMVYRGPSAKVNGVLIKDTDFNEMYLQMAQSYGQMFGQEEIKEETLKYCINGEIIKQSVKKNKLSASKAQVDRFMAQIEKRFPTPEEMEDLYSRVGVKNKKGLTELIREQLDRMLLFAHLAEEWGVKVSDEEIAERYEELELAHILVATNEQVKESPLPVEAAKERADEAYEKVVAGTEFSTIAKEYSDDPANKDNGGSLGRQTLFNFKQQFDPLFMDAAVELKTGEVSSPVKTQFGYHIIKMIDRKEASGKEYKEAKEDLRVEILGQKMLSEQKEKFDKWLKEQTENANIEIIDPALRAFRLKKDKKWDEAAAAYAKALKKKENRNELDLYLSASNVLREAEKYDEAISILNSFPKEGRLDIRIQSELARNYDAKGDKDKAKDILLKVSDRVADEVLMQRRVLEVFKELKYEEEAKTLAEKIEKIQAQQEKEQKEYEELLKNKQDETNAQLENNSMDEE
jgi:parvulin-like peptidyl-prolyl isomerase